MGVMGVGRKGGCERSCTSSRVGTYVHRVERTVLADRLTSMSNPDPAPYDWEIEECTLAEELEDVARHYAAGATTPPSPPAFDTREEERMDGQPG